MPLSKTKQAEWMRQYRQQGKRGVIPSVIPKPLPDYLVHPNRYLQAHIAAYPEGFNSDGSYKTDYNEALDPYINPLVRYTQKQ